MAKIDFTPLNTSNNQNSVVPHIDFTPINQQQANPNSSLTAISPQQAIQQAQALYGQSAPTAEQPQTVGEKFLANPVVKFGKNVAEGAVNTALIDPVNFLSYLPRQGVNAIEEVTGVPQKYRANPIQELPSKGVGGFAGNLAGFVSPWIAAEKGLQLGAKGVKAGIKLLNPEGDARVIGGIGKKLVNHYVPQVGKYVVPAAKIAAQGSLSSAMGTSEGNRTGAAELGAVLGAASPAIGKVLNFAMKPVITGAMKNMVEPLVNKVSATVKRNYSPGSEYTALDHAALKLKQAHDASKENYVKSYDYARLLGKEADDAYPNSVGDNTKGDFLNNVENNVKKDVSDKYGLTTESETGNPSEYDTYIKPLFSKILKKDSEGNLYHTSPENFGDLIAMRKRLAIQPTLGISTPYEAATNMAKKKIITAIDSKAAEIAKTDPMFKKAYSEYTNANGLFSKHANLYRKMPKAAQGDIESSSKNMMNSLNHPITNENGELVNSSEYSDKNVPAMGNLIRKNFVPSSGDESVALINKLGKMMGNQGEANAAIKTAIFSDPLRKDEGFLTKYKGIKEIQRDKLFSTGEQKLMALAQKAQKLSNKSPKYHAGNIVGHYGLSGAIGGAISEMLGHGFLPGALGGVGTKSGLEGLGYLSAKRALKSNNIDKISSLLDKKVLTPSEKKRLEGFAADIGANSYNKIKSPSVNYGANAINAGGR